MTGAGNADGPPGVYPAMPARPATTVGPPARPGAPSARGAPLSPGGPPEPLVGEDSGVAGARAAPLEVDDFSAFYESTWPGVARALAVALGDRDLAIDATDEAMARAYPRWSRLRGYDNPGAWVYRVGLNWARSHRRRLARRPRVVHPTDEHMPPVGDPAVHAALLDLPVALRSVVVCRLLLDWSVADTATALGVRPGTVQSRLHRALRSLHDSLDHLR